jgi:hypothetical protein
VKAEGQSESRREQMKERTQEEGTSAKSLSLSQEIKKQQKPAEWYSYAKEIVLISMCSGIQDLNSEGPYVRSPHIT